MNTLVIEVRGGVVQEVYSDSPHLRVIMVIWDDDHSPSEPAEAGDLHPATLADIPPDTLATIFAMTK